MTAYELISTHYGDRTTARSGVKLINHIDEGVRVLQHLGAHQETIDAYCLHPVLQRDADFVSNRRSIPGNLVTPAILAMEYRRVANSYLSKDDVSSFVGFSCPEVRQMLVADKIQNYKDFLAYHKGTHERSAELDAYFNNWFALLGVDYQELAAVIGQ